MRLKEKELLGLITDGDLRRELKNDENILNRDAQSIMTKNPTTVSFKSKPWRITSINGKKESLHQSLSCR